MTEDLIPSDVRDFIFRYIDSVAQLEALLLLRSNPTETWDAAKIAKRLYSGERETKESLSQLCQNGLAETEPLFYVSRLITFGFIIAAIVEKNRPSKPSS